MKLYTIVFDSCHGTSGPMVLGNKRAGRTKQALPRFSHLPSSRCHVDAAPSRLGLFVFLPVNQAGELYESFKILLLSSSRCPAAFRLGTKMKIKIPRFATKLIHRIRLWGN